MILSFSGEHRFLSNFHPCTVMFDGIEFGSVEHAYVAAKSPFKSVRQIISKIEKAGRAKKIGKKLLLRKDWNDVRLPIMANLIEQKFSDQHLKELLAATAPHGLVEGNAWGDTFWGQCPIGNGHNHLGKILMAQRDGFARFFE